MKKFFLLVLISAFVSASTQAQPYTISVTFMKYLTLNQVDSTITAILGSQATGVLNTKYAVNIYKVDYNTFGPDSVPTTASGLLVVPQGTPCEVPIVSFEHTEVTKKSEVPSRYSNTSQWYVGLAAGSIGNIALMPDGIGLGDGPGLHPFLHLQSEATSVIDMIRSVKEFVDTTGNAPNEQLFLAGISEGAYAAVAAHQYIQTYLDSAYMYVTATGAIAGYYDMGGTMVNMILSDTTYPNPSYLPALMLGYNQAYNFFTNDSDLFAYPYDSTIPPLFNGSYQASTINGQLPSVAKYVLRQDQIDSLQNDSTNYIRLLLAQNNAYNWAPTSPVYLLYCIADEYVPFQNSIVAYTHFVQNGSTTVDTFDIGATYDHAECAEFSVLSAVDLINQLTHQPIAATVSSTSNTSLSSPNGTATVTATQGDPPYTWHWSNGDSTATITGLAAGTYYVTTTDMAHCTNIDSVVVTFVNGINDVTLSDVSVHPNPTQGLLMIDDQNATDKLTQIEILDISGNVVAAPQTQTGNTTTLNLGAEAKGVYILNIRSESGKELHRKVVLL